VVSRHLAILEAPEPLKKTLIHSSIRAIFFVALQGRSLRGVESGKQDGHRCPHAVSSDEPSVANVDHARNTAESAESPTPVRFFPFFSFGALGDEVFF
jgi:hypothetical protein